MWGVPQQSLDFCAIVFAARLVFQTMLAATCDMRHVTDEWAILQIMQLSLVALVS